MSEKNAVLERESMPLGKEEARRRLVRGIAFTLLGATFWGINGTLSKIIMDDYGIGPLWIACLRQLTACWLFLGAARLTTPDKLHDAVRSRKALLGFLSVAVFSILMSQVSYLQAIDWTNSATATVLQSLGVVLVMFYVCVVNRRKPRKREVVGVLLACAGTFLVATGGNPSALSLPPMGLFWGLMCALAAMILAIQPVRLIKEWGNFTVNGLAFLMAGIILSALTQPWNSMPALDVRGVVLLVVSIVLGTFGAYALYLQGIKEVGSMRGAMLSTAEPVMATVTSVLLMGISFSPADIVGFAMIIVMVFLTA